MFFTVSVVNNYALNFNISMPLHMIFRAVGVFRGVLTVFLLPRPASLSLKLPPPFFAGVADRQHGPRNNHPEKEVGVPSRLTAAFNKVSPRTWVIYTVSRVVFSQVLGQQVSVYSSGVSWHLHLHHHVCQTSGESPATLWFWLWLEHFNDGVWLCRLVLARGVQRWIRSG